MATGSTRAIPPGPSRTRSTDRPADQRDHGTSTAFVDDAYGNLTKKAEDDLSQTTLAYDAADRLTGVTPAAGSAATFSFDALGRNKTRVIGGTTTDTYAYLGTSETVSEVATSGGTTRTIDAALGPDGSRLGLRNQTSSTQVWTLFDLHGDVAALENSAMSAVSDALRYDGYGVTVNTDGSFGSPWKFQGALDVASGSEPLYDIGARMYAPSLGSWTSLDSVAGSAQDPLSMNRFLYAEANPATLIDPTGHAGCDPGRKCHAGNNVIVPNADGSTTVYHHGTSTTYNPKGRQTPTPTQTASGGTAPNGGLWPSLSGGAVALLEAAGIRNDFAQLAVYRWLNDLPEADGLVPEGLTSTGAAAKLEVGDARSTVSKERIHMRPRSGSMR